ncbi:MAG: DMT family transporter [Bacteroidota bacterium]
MKNRGVVYMVVAVSFFAIMNILVKYIPGIGSVEIVFFRSLVSLVMSYFTLRLHKIPMWGNNKKWLIIRGIAGSAGLLFFFATLKMMPLGSALAVQYLSPVFTTLLGIYFAKEKVKPLQWIFFLLAFSGVVMIQGFDPRITAFQVIIGVAGAVSAGMAYNSIRKLKDSDHPMVIIFYFPLVTIPVTGVYLLTNWTTPTFFELSVLLGIGVATQFAQYFMTKAYQSDLLSKISSIQYIGIIFALTAGYFLFDETYDFKSGIGILIIILSVIFNIWYKNRSEKSEKFSK